VQRLKQLRLLKNRDFSTTFVKILPLVAFTFPLALLFLLNPIDPFLKLSAQDSFQLMWKGRTFQLFFVWLVALELILGWENIKLKITKHNKVEILVILLLPSLYLTAENYLGLNNVIVNWAALNGIAFSDSMPLAFEYLVFSFFFCLMIFAAFGRKGLKDFILPALFVGLVGFLYTIDNVFPYGQFTPFQLLVPTTSILAAGVLGSMGYSTISGLENGMPTLQVSGSLGTTKFAIAWPCAGIESLLIFTAVALLFLKRMPISWRAKIGLFAFGAAITYLINVMRIATIFIIGMQYGATSNQVQMFHFYYGPLYAMAWIISYPLIVLASHTLWKKIRKPRSIQPNPALPKSVR
jgi:thaumarchaeosortase